MPRPQRPLIGVTGPDRGGAAAWLMAALAVRLAGGRPWRVSPRRPEPPRPLDGLILGGGADVDPGLYGEERVEPGEMRRGPTAWWRFLLSWLLLPVIYVLRWLLSISPGPRGDYARDALEWRLLADALARDIPVLGICRGAQLLNVYMGGSLHQDLSSFYEESPQVHSIWPYKRVTVSRGSGLYRWLGPEARINSLHRQAINELGDGLAAVAWERAGVVQAVEGQRGALLLGVQWHPEYLPQRREQRALFRALVRAAVAARKNNGD
ncbi:putative glutamine amidotransferase [Alkalispirillum mobile]|uniref:Putative glutamine amidotransferase n=1 Tax=Alkalispirillum mobile TaxID=85925 RepID=A0A498BUE5_9GAMM|nr:gamma-glutamyl-gamma-aminobutyrate hydrolase family protein [Alkalispirillum mobile]RLK47042.1 putative glutamine amidotransferase [Alkalispirillum mobile]